MWLCDVYDGSVINITAFFSTIPKLILLSFFIKTFFVTIYVNFEAINLPLLASGLCSICFASVAAIYQKRVKRLLAYSTISHTGFLVISISCFTIDSVKACVVYIIVYVLMTLCLFSLLFISGIDNKQQKYISHWTSMPERNTAIALSFALLLCSVAGIPPLAGFYSKLCILVCLLIKGQVLITLIIAVFSSISCFYYIRLIKVFFFTSGVQNLAWIGSGTKNIESFVSLSMVVITLFLIRPNFIIDYSIATSLALT
jgi:NADH-quinone oxidoreductase subunit N